jgi:CheY-like chemotaxis protein
MPRVLAWVPRLLFIAAALAGTVASYRAFHGLAEQLRQADERELQRGLTTTTALARAGQTPLLLEDGAEMRELLENVMVSDPAFDAAAFFDASGRPAMSSDPEFLPPSQAFDAAKERGNAYAPIEGDGSLFVTAIKKGDETLGYAAVRTFNAASTHTAREALKLGAGAFLLAFGLTALAYSLRMGSEKRRRLELAGRVSTLVQELRNPIGALHNTLHYLRDSLHGSEAAQEDPSIEEFIGLSERELRGAQAALAVIDGPVSPEEPSAEPQPMKPGQRPPVLVIDDKEAFRRTLGGVLRRRGYAVELAADGEDGLARASAAPFGAVVLDWEGDTSQRFEALRRLKALRPGAGVILTSAATPGPDVAQALHEGAFAFLRKPFEPDALIGLIDRALNRGDQG